MIIQDYHLYRANIFRDKANPNELVYIITNSWPNMFNQLYERFGAHIIINSVELVANENINLFIDESYSLNKVAYQEPPTVITNIAKFSNNY